MGDPLPHPPVLLLLAAFSRHEAALDWARRGQPRRGGRWRWKARGSIHRDRLLRRHDGDRLEEGVFRFPAAVRSGGLVEIKLETNRWEEEYAARGRAPEPRPLNLDPGYLTPAKLVLASTKDFAHRIYLSPASMPKSRYNTGITAGSTTSTRFPTTAASDYQAFLQSAGKWPKRKMKGAGRWRAIEMSTRDCVRSASVPFHPSPLIPLSFIPFVQSFPCSG